MGGTHPQALRLEVYYEGGEKDIFSQYKAYFDFYNTAFKFKGSKDKFLIGSACIFEKKKQFERKC